MSKLKLTDPYNQPEHALANEVLAFVEAQVGRLYSARFCGWPHGESRVWALSTSAGACFMKQYRQPRKFNQELFAFKQLIPQLPAQAPRLLAFNTELRCIVMRACAGDTLEALVKQQCLTRKQLQDVHRQAGSFLHALHTLPHQDTDVLSLADALIKRQQAWSLRAPYLSTRLKDHVAACIKEAAEHMKQQRLTRVYCHRDYSHRNWLASGYQHAQLQVSIIDFEHTRPDMFLVDFERLTTREWLDAPDLKDAFFEGYGRTLTDDENTLLAHYTTLAAMTTIIWSREHHDADFEAQAWRTLTRLNAPTS